MKRRLFNLLAGLSLLLFVVTVGGRLLAAYAGNDLNFYGDFGATNICVYSSHNFIIVAQAKDKSQILQPATPPDFPVNFTEIWISYAWPLSFFSLLPICWIVKRWLRSFGFQAGHCQSCGYDLRATLDRCPECGSIPEKTTGKS